MLFQFLDDNTTNPIPVTYKVTSADIVAKIAEMSTEFNFVETFFPYTFFLIHIFQN